MDNSNDPRTVSLFIRAEFEIVDMDAIEFDDDAIDFRFSSESSVVIELLRLDESENVRQRRIALTVSI